MRPDWASGADKDKWEGWDTVDEGAMRRKTDGYIVTICICDDGLLVIPETLGLDSPADALDVANLIAEKLGGWGE